MGISYEECEREFLEFFKLFEKYAFFFYIFIEITKIVSLGIKKVIYFI